MIVKQRYCLKGRCRLTWGMWGTQTQMNDTEEDTYVVGVMPTEETTKAI